MSIKSNNQELARDQLNTQTYLDWLKMDQIKLGQTWIFNYRINFISELKVWKIPKLNRWVKLNQSKLNTDTF